MGVAVCVCTSERDDQLAALLAHLATIPLPEQTIAIVVVDNRPNAATAALCRRAAATAPIPLHYVAEPSRGISFARNRAVDAALGLGADWLALIDDDDLPEPDWLEQLLNRQQATGAAVVMGNRRYVLPPGASPAAVERLLERPLTDDTRLWDPFGLPFRQSTCNVLLEAGLLRRLAAQGPVFDPELALVGGEDLDFFCRAERSGAPFARAALSLVNQRIRMEHATVRGLLRRRFRHGLTRGILVRRYVVGGPRAAWQASVRARMASALLRLPPRLLSSNGRAQEIIKMAWALGCWYGYWGGRYHYYGKNGVE
jgi:succinoglycan biosynthesis protein ExoM